MIEGILIGLTTALTFQNIFMVMIGCFFGNNHWNVARPWTNDSDRFNDTL